MHRELINQEKMSCSTKPLAAPIVATLIEYFYVNARNENGGCPAAFFAPKNMRVGESRPGMASK